MASKRPVGSYRLEKLWRECERDLVDADGPVEHYRDVRRAFYAGAAAMIGLVDQFADDHDIVDGVERLEMVRQELSRFFQMMTMGVR